jgi:aryl-alcohol dehydrogenase
MLIKAAVAREAHGPFSVEQVTLAEPQADEVLVRLTATGICHTDLSIVDQIMPLPLPYVLGHEGAGVVERVGESVTGIAPGDHVVLTFDTCGHCASCSDHHPAYCENYGLLNFFTRRPDGTPTLHDAGGAPLGGAFFGQSSFATHALAHQRNAIVVRKDAPLDLLGPLGCGLSTGAGTVVNVLKPDAGTTIAVFGTGAVGMAALMAARILGAGRIVAVDRVASRLALARELGATDTIDTSQQDLDQALTALGGLHQAIDTTGVGPLIASAVGALKERGTCVLLGASKDPALTLNILHLISGRVIRGVVNGDCDPAVLIPQMIDWFLEGRFPIDRLSAFYPLDAINDAVADSHSGKTIKPILKFVE